jgi:hypothetical protein
MTEAAILHCIELPTDLNAGAKFPLRMRLDLGVGGNGVIGRRVSLLASGRVVGEGIMGWN